MLTEPIVLSTKQIVFEHYSGAYNPSIMKNKEGYLMIFRYTPDPNYQWNVSYFGLVQLDENFDPIEEPVLLSPRWDPSKTLCQAEDARLFNYKGHTLIIYNDNVDEPYDLSKGRDMFLVELQVCKEGYSLSQPLRLQYGKKENAQLVQKNWIPFEWDQKLLLTYSIEPHEIVELQTKTGECSLSYLTSSKFKWTLGSLRGSTSPHLVEDHYLSFFHSSRWMTSEWSKEPSWHYFMGAYTFDAKPPFKMQTISPAPIIGDDFYAENGTIKRVIFPGGFVLDGDRIYLAYGREDSEIWIATLDYEALKRSMVPVQ